MGNWSFPLQEDLVFARPRVQETYSNFSGFLVFQTPPVPSAPDSSWLTNDTTFETLKNAAVNGIFLYVENDAGTSFSENIFSTTTYSSADVDNILSYVRTRNARGWGNSIYNWLYIDTEPTQIDFKNSTHTTRLINNWLVAGQLVKNSQSNGVGFKGIAFDNESYGAGKFQYSTSAQAGSYTLDQYNTAAYDTGFAIGDGLKDIDDNFQVFFLNGYFLYWAYLQANEDTQPYRETNPSGLLRPFMDGIYDGFGERYTGGTKNIIIGSEDTYSCKSQLCVQQNMILATGTNPYNVYTPYSDISRFKGQSEYFDTITEFAPGIWPTYRESLSPIYNNNTPWSNYFTPRDMIQTMRYQLPYARYIWMFMQKGSIYYPLQANSALLNSEYTDALAQLKDELNV